MLLELFTPVLIFCGAVAMLLALLRTRKILTLLTNSRCRRDWQSLSILMLLFLLGYLAAVVLVLKGAAVILSLLLGVIFFFGALFVYLVVRTGHLTIADLEETTVSRQDLEQIVKQRTKELDEANERLAKLDAAKTDFISVISHELRTPLTIVKGYTQILNRRPLLAADKEAKALFRGVLAGVERLQGVVACILDLTRIESGALCLQKTPASFAEIIECTAVEFGNVLEERRLTLTMERLQDLPIVSVDPDLICKAFHQLIMNAIKYTPDGGAIRLTGEVVDNGAPPAIKIEIRDTGIGIAKQNQQAIFDKFFQTGPVMLHSSGSTKFKAGGPGLGLAIAKGIVAAHDGDLWVESDGYDEETSPGSRFYVQLPMAEVKQ